MTDEQINEVMRLAEAQARIPEVFKRLPQPVELFMQLPKGSA